MPPCPFPPDPEIRWSARLIWHMPRRGVEGGSVHEDSRPDWTYWALVVEVLQLLLALTS